LGRITCRIVDVYRRSRIGGLVELSSVDFTVCQLIN